MDFDKQLGMSVGPFQVITTSNGGHPPEFFAENLTARLISIAETAPPEIKLQAIAFREAMSAVILEEIKRAIVSNHTTVIYQLRKAGMDEAAALVWEMRT